MTIRGLRLFVRPIEAEDHDDLRAFYAKTGVPSLPPAWGVLGKLLGEVVAVVAMEITADAVRIDDIVVVGELRRKRIGRAMMREVEQLAVKFDRRKIIIEEVRGAQEFFRRIGFVSEGDRWVRVVS